jgi:membrane protein required for colicin V production
MESLQPFMNITDILVGIFMLFGLLSGMKRGLSNELFRLISIIIAIVVAYRFDELGAVWLAKWVDWPAEELTKPAFFGIIVAVYIVLAIIRLALRLLMTFSFKPKIELLGGGLLGLTRAIIFVAIIIFALLAGDFGEALGVEESVSGQLVREYVMPRYHAVAEQYPELKLPEVEEGSEESRDGAKNIDIEQFLGPLIDLEHEKSDE